MLARQKAKRVRTATTCPTCGGRAGAASYRGAKKPGTKSGKFQSIGRAYCPTCDKLLPRKKR